MPELIMLIGLPGSGKSTYRNKIRSEDKNYLELSTDDMVDEEAARQGKTYSEVFHTLNHKELASKMKIMFRQGLNEGRNIIIDRTNMSEKRRKEFLKIVPDTYEKIAVVFSLPDNELKKRIKERAERTGKDIPSMVLTTMARSYTPPTTAEFDKIVTIHE